MAKDYAKAFYNSSAWRKTQAAYLSNQQYICEDCGGVASIAHHIRYITPENITDPTVTLDWDNLKAVCIDCHALEHQARATWLHGVAFDESGNIIKRPNVFLVCGPDALDYIHRQRTARDLVIDTGCIHLHP